MELAEYLYIHRMARCGEPRCLLEFFEEMSLELPEDPVQREEWYREQQPEYTLWRRNLFLHRWSFQNGRCNHCEARGIVLAAAQRRLCVEWCLNTNLARYPSGHQQPNLSDVIAHTRRCTSHLSSLTSKHIERLETLYGLSSHTAGMERYGHTFLSKKDVTPKTYSSPMPSQNSAWWTLPPLDFSSPKN